MDIVCLKCTQACIFLPANNRNLSDLVSIEKAQSTYFVRQLFMWHSMHEITFPHWFYSIPFKNTSNFVFNIILYILKYVQYLWTNNCTPSSLTVKFAFPVGKWINCFVLNNIIESWVWPPRDRTSHGIT